MTELLLACLPVGGVSGLLAVVMLVVGGGRR